MARVESMPRAASEIPYMLARVNDTKIVTAMAATGMTVEWKPSASPPIMFGAAPVTHDYESFCTGE